MTRRELMALAATGAFGAERLNRAPISHDPLHVTLPHAEPVKLANGLEVLAMEDNRLPIATVLFQVEGAGSIYSPKPGVAEVTADMLLEGAGDRSGKQIVDEASRLGATVTTTAGGGAETVSIEGSGLTSRFADWLALQSTVLLHPTFPADEFTGVRQRKVVEARLRLTRPATSPSMLRSASYTARTRRDWPRRLRKPSRRSRLRWCRHGIANATRRAKPSSRASGA